MKVQQKKTYRDPQIGQWSGRKGLEILELYTYQNGISPPNIACPLPPISASFLCDGRVRPLSWQTPCQDPRLAINWHLMALNLEQICSLEWSYPREASCQESQSYTVYMGRWVLFMRRHTSWDQRTRSSSKLIFSGCQKVPLQLAIFQK